MGKKKSSNELNSNPSPAKSPVKHNDIWSTIESGEAKSASVSHYKEPKNEPKFVHPAKLAKPKKIFDGLDIPERILSHGKIEEKSGGKKRKNRESSPKTENKKQKVDAKPKEHVVVKKQNKRKISNISKSPE